MTRWTPTWNGLIEQDPFDLAAAERTRDHISASLSEGLCPACAGRDFTHGDWESTRDEATYDTVICLGCGIIWPPQLILNRMDFRNDPPSVPMMGETVRMITRWHTS